MEQYQPIRDFVTSEQRVKQFTKTMVVATTAIQSIIFVVAISTACLLDRFI